MHKKPILICSAGCHAVRRFFFPPGESLRLWDVVQVPQKKVFKISAYEVIFMERTATQLTEELTNYHEHESEEEEVLILSNA